MKSISFPWIWRRLIVRWQMRRHSRFRPIERKLNSVSVQFTGWAIPESTNTWTPPTIRFSMLSNWDSNCSVNSVGYLFVSIFHLFFKKRRQIVLSSLATRLLPIEASLELENPRKNMKLKNLMKYAFEWELFSSLRAGRRAPHIQWKIAQ